MNPSDRLRNARIEAGFESATQAADRFGWTRSTYSAHENGTRGFGFNEAEIYGAAFEVSPSKIAFGVYVKGRDNSTISKSALRRTLSAALAHQDAKKVAPRVLADLIFEVADFASKNDANDINQIVEFSFSRTVSKR